MRARSRASTPNRSSSRSAPHPPSRLPAPRTIAPAALTARPVPEIGRLANSCARFLKMDGSRRNQRAVPLRTRSGEQLRRYHRPALKRNPPHESSRQAQAKHPGIETAIREPAPVRETPRDSPRTTKQSSRRTEASRSNPAEAPRPAVPASRFPSMQLPAPPRHESTALCLTVPKLRWVPFEGPQWQAATKCNPRCRRVE